jgi:type I restriction enzyme, S subunit
MNLPAYSETKPGGFKGLGNLPKHWEVIRGRFVMLVNPSAPLLRKLKSEDEVSFVPMEAVSEYGGLNLDQTRVIADVSNGYTEFQDGDVVVAKITPCFENGKAALARGLLNGAAYGTTELHVLRAGPTLDRGFLFYVAISDRFRKLGESEMYGAGGQKRVPPEFNKDFPMPLPPAHEQKQIAAFLDWKTGQIDALIFRKKELLEKLKEKRIAVITQAVTKGLNRAVPLRDSGIPWLGRVPQHWDVMKMSWVCRSIRDGTHNPPDRALGIHRLLSVRNVQDGRFVLLSDDRTMTPEDFAELQRSYTVEENDIVLAIVGATTGKSAIVGRLENVTVQRSLAILRPDGEAITSSFLHYVIQSPVVQTEIALTVFKYSAQPGIYLDDVGRLPVVRPPLPEQTVIVEYLDAEIKKLDALVGKIEEAIKRLIEYRTALITAATTGKIDLRGVKIPEPVG